MILILFESIISNVTEVKEITKDALDWDLEK
jgi:hypothetical protein